MLRISIFCIYIDEVSQKKITTMWKNVYDVSDEVIFYEKPKKFSQTLQNTLYCQGKIQGTWNFPKILLLVIEYIYTKVFWCD